MIQRKSRITKKKIQALLKEFVYDSTAKNASEKLEINRNTANKWFTHFRESIFEKYNHAPRFSGEVEIDEKDFGRGSKKKREAQRIQKNNYGDPDYVFPVKHKGRRAEKVKVLGIMRRNGDVYTQIVKNASRETIFPIIHLVVDGGTTIFTDGASIYEFLIERPKSICCNDKIIENLDQKKGICFYSCLLCKKECDILIKENEYKHESINHSKGFINKKGVHIGTIESFWGHASGHLSLFKGLSRRNFPLYIKECEFRWNHKDRKEMLKILKKII